MVLYGRAAVISKRWGGLYQAGMSVVLRLGAAQLLVRDALRRPLAQLELGEVDAGLQRHGASVMQAHLGVRACAWTYNAVITAWEPLIEPWDLILKLESNSSPFVRAPADLPASSRG